MRKTLFAAVAAVTASAMLATFAVPASAAPKKYVMYGTIEALAPNPQDPNDSRMEYTQTNPEGNFNAACRRGQNGADQRLRVGLMFPILDGNGRRVGSAQIVDGYWVEDFGLKGNCFYEYVSTKMKRSNYYCPNILGDMRLAAERADAVGTRLEFDTEYAGAFPPVTRPDGAASLNWRLTKCYI